MSQDAMTCDPSVLAGMVKAGDPASVGRLAQCYGGCLRSVGLARCASCEDAEDAVQEALLSAAVHLGDYEGRGSLQSWLSTMVIRACHRMRRGQKNDPGLHTGELDGLSEAVRLEDTIEARAVAQRAIEALATLPEAQRRLFLLAAVEGWTAPELAEAFEISPGAVRTRLTRIRQHLREAI